MRIKPAVHGCVIVGLTSIDVALVKRSLVPARHGRSDPDCGVSAPHTV